MCCICVELVHRCEILDVENVLCLLLSCVFLPLVPYISSPQKK